MYTLITVDICNFESGISVRVDNISTGDTPISKISENEAAWTRTNLRTYLYPSEWDHFMYMLECEKADPAALLAIMPRMSLKATLHCDAGPAFIGLTKCVLFHIIPMLFRTQQRFRNEDVDLDRTSCAKHMETNVSSLSPDIKDPTMELLYGKHITIHMALDIRDTLFSLVHSPTSTLSKTMKDWFMTNFGTDAGMRVSVHSPFAVVLD